MCGRKSPRCTVNLDFNPILNIVLSVRLIEGRHLEASWWWSRMRRPRACLAKHAPGRRRGSAWRPIGAARQELADGWPSAVARLRQPGAGNGSKAREAGRARETVNEKRGPAQQGRRRDGAPGGAPCFREGTRALKEQ